MGSPRSSELVPPEADRQTNTNGQHGDIFPPDGVRFGAPVDSCVLYPARAGRIDTCFYVTPPYGVFSGIYVFLSSRSRTYFAMSDISYMTMTIRYLVPGYIISLVSLSLHYMSRFYWWLGGRWWCRRLEEGEERIFLFFFCFLPSLLISSSWRFYPQRSSGQGRPWSQVLVSSLLPPGTCLRFSSRIGFSIPTARRSSSNVANSRSRAFR